MTKQELFICYQHKSDEYFRNRLEELLGDSYIIKSVKAGDANANNSDAYIEKLIQEGYVTSSSVCVVLVGPNTFSRKHVDWEICAALNKKPGGYSGLVGLLLPTHPGYGKDKFPRDVPERLVDNIKTGYAKLYDWDEDSKLLRKLIEDSFTRKKKSLHLLDNSRKLLKYNKINMEFWLIPILAVIFGILYNYLAK